MHNHLLLYNFTSQGQFHNIIYDVTSQLKEKKNVIPTRWLKPIHICINIT